MELTNGFDASDLSRFGLKRHPLYLGIAFLVAIEATVTGTLVVTYFYLRAGAGAWPPADAAAPALAWPTVSLALLLASAFTMWWAGRGSDRGDYGVLTLGVGASTLLAVVVLVLRSFQLAALGTSWDDDAYGSIVWTITGFHFVHVLSAVVGTATVTLLAWRRYFTPERQLGVVVDTLYWYFVAAVWIPLYLVLYWAPRLS